MPSKCPKCGRILEEDYICCADVEITYKCTSCGKLSKGFVMPFGRCYLCGGRLEVIEEYSGVEDLQEVTIVREAMQLEINNYVLYMNLRDHAANEEVRKVFNELYEEEKGHLAELENKYHVTFDHSQIESQQTRDNMFMGIEIDPQTTDPRALLEKAILMERAAKDFYQKQADGEVGKKKKIYQELAAEEEEHEAILESKLALLD